MEFFLSKSLVQIFIEEETEICRNQLYRLFYSISAKDFGEKADNYFDSFCTRIIKLKGHGEKSRQKLLSSMEKTISEFIHANDVAHEFEIEHKESRNFPIAFYYVICSRTQT